MTNQDARRRYTKNPRYAHQGGLPSVYPFKRILSREDAGTIASYLSYEIRTGSPYWFAVTGHTQNIDGHVTLWLSVEAALYLQRVELINYVEETGNTRK